MNVIVPYSPIEPKSRLSPVLSLEERQRFSRAMLRDVVDAVRGAGHDPVLLAPRDVRVDDVPLVVDDRALSRAVDARLARSSLPVALVMADLALATEAALTRLFESPGDVAIAPGRRGGTNALVVDHPDFSVDFHGLSYRDHRRICADVGAEVGVVDSFRLATDVDEPVDLVEVLLHTDGRAREYLRDLGVTLDSATDRDAPASPPPGLAVEDD